MEVGRRGRPAQVTPDFRCDAVVEKQTGDPKEAMDIVRQRRKQARAWLRREGQKQWRPRKRARVASWETLLTIENALQLHGGASLKDFQLPVEADQRPPPHQWKVLSIARDSGPDMLCAVNFLQRGLRLLVDETPDPSHCAHRDVQLAIRHSGLWAHELTMLTVWNTPFGAWDEDVRYKQALASLDSKFSDPTYDIDQDPVFQALLPGMIRDQGMCHLAGDPNISRLVWEAMRDRSCWATKGSRVHLNRFLAVIRTGLHEMQCWHERLFAYTWIAIEMDMLKGAKLERLRLKDPASGQGDDAASVPLQHATPDKQALKAACQNTLVLSVLALSAPENNMKQRVILAACEPVEAWHSSQNKATRNVSDTFAWMAEQLSHGFMDHLGDIWSVLGSFSKLDWVGFTTVYSSAQANIVDDPMHLQIVSEQELALLLCKIVVCLVGQRLKRHMWMMRGWPNRSILMLAPPPGQTAEDAVALLKNDLENWRKVEGGAHRHRASPMFERSTFRLGVVEHLTGMLDADGWELSGKTEKALRDRHSRLIQTQVNEDAFNRMRYLEQKKPNKVSRQEELYRVVIEKGVLHKVHGFDQIQRHEVGLPRGLDFPPAAFQPKATLWKALKGIVGHNQKSAWWSGGPTQHHVPHCDLEFFKYLVDEKHEHLADCAWLSCLISSPTILVRRIAALGQPDNDWMMCMAEVSGSASICWPFDVASAPGDGDMPRFRPRKVKDFMTLPWAVVVDETLWEAVAIEWTCPLAMWSRCPASRMTEPSASLCAWATSPPGPLLTVAAMQAFFDLSRPTLIKLSGRVGVPFSEGDDLFTVCFGLVQGVLQCTDAECLDVVGKRLAATAQCEDAAIDAFMDLDEALDMMKMDDRKDIVAEQTEIKKHRESHETMATAYKTKRVQVSGKPGRLPSGSAAAVLKRPETRAGEKIYIKAVPAEIEQWQIRHLTPEGGFIWRGNVAQQWSCHFPPYSRRSFSFRLWGGERSCII